MRENNNLFCLDAKKILNVQYIKTIFFYTLMIIFGRKK